MGREKRRRFVEWRAHRAAWSAEAAEGALAENERGFSLGAAFAATADHISCRMSTKPRAAASCAGGGTEFETMNSGDGVMVRGPEASRGV